MYRADDLVSLEDFDREVMIIYQYIFSRFVRRQSTSEKSLNNTPQTGAVIKFL